MRCSSSFKNTMSLLCGLSAGAAAVYLFDPKQGQKRRHDIARSAEDAWDTLRHKTGEYGTATAASLTALGAAAGHKTGELSQRARDFGGYYGERALGLKDDLSTRMHGWMD